MQSIEGVGDLPGQEMKFVKILVLAFAVFSLVTADR